MDTVGCALVTGAGKRVGRQIALTLGGAGFDVIVHYRGSETEAADVVSELHGMGRDRSRSIQADLTSAEDVRRLIADIRATEGALKVLVNNAAAFAPASLLGGDDEAWERAWETSLATNLVAPARLSRGLAPLLAPAGGVIVNLHDIAAETVWEDFVAHGCAKAGLRHLTRCMAAELAPAIRVCGVMPSIAIFPPEMNESERNNLLAKTLLKKSGNAQQIADAVRFVVENSYLTGAHIPVDGGWSVHRS